MAVGMPIGGLEEKLGYTFADADLLRTALTHSSYANENHPHGASNERLEFLGDSVLQTVVSEHLYHTFPELAEGDLTRMREKLVCGKTLACVAKELSLADYMNVGSAEESNGCRANRKVSADALEAVIGAVYLDSKGSGAERSLVLRLLGTRMNGRVLLRDDAKTRLQQLVEKAGDCRLEYEVTDVTGPEHDRRFTVAVKIDGNVFATGCATSIKEAEMNAAEAALPTFGERGG